MTSEDVSGDKKKKVSGLATAAIGVATAAATGGVIGSAVHATRSKPEHGDDGSTATTTEVKKATETTETLSRDFCLTNLSNFSDNFYETGSLDEKQAAWNVSQTLSVQFPELAAHDFGLELGQFKRVLVIDEVSDKNRKVPDAANARDLTSMLKKSPKLSGGYENVLITQGGETVFYGPAKFIIRLFQEFGFAQPQNIDNEEFLLGLSGSGTSQYRVTVVDRANEDKENRHVQNISSFVNFPDDTVLLTEANLSNKVKKSVPNEKQDENLQNPAPTINRSPHPSKLKHAVSKSTATDVEPSSAAVVAAGTAAMRSLYTRHAREGSSSLESMTFSADIDAAAQEIQRVCTGAASDEAALASLLLSKTVEQRYLIWWRYRILFKQSLTVWVKSTSNYGVLLQMLASPLEQVEAEILRKATKGLGTTEEWIYPVVMARSNAEIALLKKTFQEKYGEDLVKVLSSDLSGDLKKVILAAMRGEVADFNASIHTSAKAAADADALYKAGEGRMGTDETTFITILVLSPAEHLRNINTAYIAKYNTGLVGAITAEFSGGAKHALLFLVRSVLEPVELLAQLFETTLTSAGKSAYGVSAWVVRYYRLLVRIRTVYMRLYGQELRTRIQSVASGEYGQLLLSVFDAAEVEFGASASESGSTSGAAVRSSSTVMSDSRASVSGAAIGMSASVDEKASVSSSGAVSARATESVAGTRSVSGSSKTETSGVSGEPSSATVVAAAAWSQ
ncbi:Annexin (Annexin) Family [Phytophthora infestans T30-4]|uniref:Annexin (Annexin) Family n=2 Tax=Phytophthora infestans (strain T30-4) TaxID=403677 RepID=D0NIJ5_PHYIT|nr:Annexin (Annexin) Family [Phytophthora infestans T30-4]EEY59329.1 Annexin (Annexin) Family [Phytophthora infestans T30-4]|eukprot:XP_002900939.1 Annexin (Annexin) Family [Phytophthora infestans T30-4]